MKDTTEMQQAVKIYKALGEPTRLKIALLLKEESTNAALCWARS